MMASLVERGAVEDCVTDADRRAALWVRNVRACLFPSHTVQRIELQRGSRRLIAISYRRGPLELYERDEDGLEMFLGYAKDVL